MMFYPIKSRKTMSWIEKYTFCVVMDTTNVFECKQSLFDERIEKYHNMKFSSFWKTQSTQTPNLPKNETFNILVILQ